MLIFTTHNYLFFSRKEIWFYNGEPFNKGTYNTFSAAKKIINEGNHFLEKYITSVIDLSKSEQELFASIHPTYRYDIRCADKYELQNKVLFNPGINDCKSFFTSYNSFAKDKGLPFISFKRIMAVRQTGNLCIIKAFLDGTEILSHIYFFDENTVSLIHSFHNLNFSNNKVRSEANKWLHWQDILLFKKMNLKTYDFGGLNAEKLPGVNKFKISFGGQTVENYRFIRSSPFIFFFLYLIKKLIKN